LLVTAFAAAHAMTKPGRTPCINPSCRRTADAAKYEPGEEIICGKCFRALPATLRRRYRTTQRRERRVLDAINRRIARGTATAARVDRLHRTFEAARWRIWQDIRAAVIRPEKPDGLTGFLDEIGLS
jgi:hypothetical protein